MNEHITRIRARLHDLRSSSAFELTMVTADRWHDSGAQWIRIHSTPRRALFTPMKISGGPLTSGEVGKQRVTYGIYDDGQRFIIRDMWQNSSNPHEILHKPWTGFTVFEDA